MSLGNSLRASLEDAGIIEVGNVEVVNEDERTESQIDMDEYRDSVVKVDQLEATVEMISSLENLALLARAMVANGTASQESAALLTSSLESVLGDAEVVDSHCMSFESGSNVEVFHQHVATSLEGMVKKLAQNAGELMSNVSSGWGIALASQSNKAKKITSRAIELKKWFTDRKDQLENADIDFRSSGLLGIYHVDGKRPADFEKAFQKDANTVSEMIKESSAAYKKAIEGVMSALEKSKTDDELVAAISKLKHPVSEISPSLMVKDALLISSAFRVTPGKPISRQYDFGPINEAKRVKLTSNATTATLKMLPTMAFAPIAIMVGGKGRTNDGTATNVLDGVVNYARTLEQSVRGANKIDDLSGKLANISAKAVEAGISRSAVNAANSLVVDLAAALAKTEQSTWAHGFEICRLSLSTMSSLARKVNKGEAPNADDYEFN